MQNAGLKSSVRKLIDNFILKELIYLLFFAEKYPQIKELFGVDHTFKYKVIGLTLIQLGMLFVIRDQSWLMTVALAYCFGGVINHALMLGKSV